MKLVVRQLLGAAPEAGTLQFLDDLAQGIVLAAEFVVRGNGRSVRKSSHGGSRTLGRDQRVERVIPTPHDHFPWRGRGHQ